MIMGLPPSYQLISLSKTKKKLKDLGRAVEICWKDVLLGSFDKGLRSFSLYTCDPGLVVAMKVDRLEWCDGFIAMFFLTLCF